jgi:hypothetical protein
MCRQVTTSLLLALGLMACGSDDKKLKVTNLDPRVGDMQGGTFVTVTGNRFVDDGPRNVRVLFGNRLGTVVRTLDDRTMVIQAPGGKPDETVDIKFIFEPGGTLVIDKAFTYKDQSSEQMGVDALDTSKVKKQ